MKKILVGILSLTLIVAFSSCEHNPDSMDGAYGNIDGIYTFSQSPSKGEVTAITYAPDILNTEISTEQISESLSFADIDVNYSGTVLLTANDSVRSKESKKFNFNTSGDNDIYIYAEIYGAVNRINIIDPTGKIYDTVSYISPDSPYTISNAQSGFWEIEIVGLDENDINEIISNLGDSINDYSIPSDYSDINEEYDISQYIFDSISMESTDFNLLISEEPTPILCETDIHTNNPTILSELFSNEKNIVILNNDTVVDLNEILPDGIYELSIFREINHNRSQTTTVNITVDTTPPEVNFVNQFETYDEGIFLHGICSEDTIDVKFDGESGYLSSVPDFGIYIELEVGTRNIEIELTDICGNKTIKNITLTRLS